jgi:hypothetical protein
MAGGSVNSDGQNTNFMVTWRIRSLKLVVQAEDFLHYSRL